MTLSTGSAHQSDKKYSGPWASRFERSLTRQRAIRVGLIADVPDMETFQRIMESETAAEAMKSDGVRPDTIQTFVEP